MYSSQSNRRDAAYFAAGVVGGITFYSVVRRVGPQALRFAKSLIGPPIPDRTFAITDANRNRRCYSAVGRDSTGLIVRCGMQQEIIGDYEGGDSHVISMPLVVCLCSLDCDTQVKLRTLYLDDIPNAELEANPSQYERFLRREASDQTSHTEMIITLPRGKWVPISYPFFVPAGERVIVNQNEPVCYLEWISLEQRPTVIEFVPQDEVNWKVA